MNNPMPVYRKKILFIGLSCVGDVVMTSPILGILHEKFPNAIIDVVADYRSKNLYENLPGLGKIFLKNKGHFLRGIPALIRQLWATKYDIIVDVRTDGLSYLLRAEKRYTKMFARSYGEHAVEALMGVIFSLHGENKVPDTSIWLSEKERKKANMQLSFFSNKDRLLAVCAGDVRRPNKCWSSNKLIELINKYEKKFTGVLFLGGELDKERTLKVADKIGIQNLNTIGSSLLESAAFLENSILFLGPDSGLGHIASAVNTPVVSMFSVDSPKRCRPWGKNVICLEGKNKDARNILITDVDNAIKEIVNE